MLPYYVGMSEQVLYRTREHIRLHMTGSYWVYDAESLADARKSVIYKPMSTDEALAIGIDFYRTARSQLERTCLIVAPIDVDRAWLLRVESALIRELAAEPNLSRIQDNGGVSKRTAEGDRVDIPISLPDVVALTLKSSRYDSRHLINGVNEVVAEPVGTADRVHRKQHLLVGYFGIVMFSILITPTISVIFIYYQLISGFRDIAMRKLKP
ncbi:MAG: hypothetical protein HUJ28_12895 [Chromatiales bacterium]|nr:hypothetical protein [Chromatiales bacterium]